MNAKSGMDLDDQDLEPEDSSEYMNEADQYIDFNSDTAPDYFDYSEGDEEEFEVDDYLRGENFGDITYEDWEE